MFMIWLRNGIVYLLSLLFFTTLLTGVITTNINIALAHPNKLEAWLNQSGLYSSFVDTAIKQADVSSGGSGGSNTVSLSDAAVHQAAQAAFSPALLQQDANTFLNSNYAWLEGKTSKPSFVIDFTNAKLTFAQQVGQYVTTHLGSLPRCTTSQIAAMPNFDPLSVTCRPASISAAAEGTRVSQSIASGSGFLSNPVITADTISPSSNGNSQAYYKKFSLAPKVYQWAIKLPLIIAGVALLSALGIVYISSRKRKGLRRVAIILAFAGAIFIATRFAADFGLKQLETQAFNNSSLGDMQQSLTAFARLVASQIVKINLYFGIAFVAIAVIIFIAIVTTRDRKAKFKTKVTDTPATDSASETTAVTKDSVTPSSTPETPKRPRLVQ